MPHIRRETPLRDALMFGAVGAVSGGFPFAWLLLSPKSPFRSGDPTFVTGFNTGVAFTLMALLGMLFGGFAVVCLLRAIRCRMAARRVDKPPVEGTGR